MADQFAKSPKFAVCRGSRTALNRPIELDHLLTDRGKGGASAASPSGRSGDGGPGQAYLDQHCNEFTGDFSVVCGDWQPLDGASLTSSSRGLRAVCTSVRQARPLSPTRAKISSSVQPVRP